MRDITIDLNDFDSDDAKTLYEATTIRAGEHNASQLLITLDEDYEDYSTNLIFSLNRTIRYVESDVTVVDGLITYPIPNSLLTEAGTLKVEIQNYSTTTFLIKSITIYFQVQGSVNDSGVEVPPNAWENIMFPTTYDPTNVDGDAFDMDNMVEGDDNLILTNAEREAIETIITSHNSLDDLNEGDYVHLTAAEYSALIALIPS